MELPDREKLPEAMLRRKREGGAHVLPREVELAAREMKRRGEAARMRQRERVIQRPGQRERLLHSFGGTIGIAESPERPRGVTGAGQARIQTSAESEREVGAVLRRIVPGDALLQMRERRLVFALVERHEPERVVRRQADRRVSSHVRHD